MPDEAAEYTSPKRCLARCFRLSRDRWKQKATERLQRIKALKVNARDLRVSRDLWKQKALHYAQILRGKGLLPAEALTPAPPPDVPAGADLPSAPPHQPQATPVSKKKTRHGR